MPESSLSWQTYLALFIVSNKSISPGLSHLPLDSWLSAPSSFPGPRHLGTGPQDQLYASRHWAGVLLTHSYSTSGHPVPSLFSLFLRWPQSAAMLLDPQLEFHDKGQNCLGDTRDYSLGHTAQPLLNFSPSCFGVLLWDTQGSPRNT